MVKKKAKPSPSRKKTAAKKKAPPKKALAKKIPAKKKTAKKSAGKKASPKKRPAKKIQTKKAAPKKKSAVKKTPVKKTAAKKPVQNKSTAEKLVAAKKKAASAKNVPAPKKKTSKSAAPNAAAKPKSLAPPSKPAPKGKALPKQFLLDLAEAIRSAVAPLAGSAKSRQVVSTAPSGDATFEIDVVAEKALLAFLRGAKYPVAYYSEDAGYSTFSSAAPKYLLVIDPIDGTRAAKNGFEGCTVSIATTRVIERPTMSDLDNACVAEILGNRVFYAERGKGVRITEGGSARRPRLSANVNLETLSWSMTVPARPAELIFPTAARLIDLSSLKGGFFGCNSTSYSVTRLLTGQLDACVDFAGRYLKDIPDCVEDYFINAGRGATLGICPYDLAGSLLIAQEAGCVVTDAYGNGFDDVLLLDSSVSNQQSLIAASNPELHKLLLSFFDTRIRQFERLLERRAALKSRTEN